MAFASVHGSPLSCIMAEPLREFSLVQQIWSLQYIRAIAALSVVMFHILEGTSHKWPIGAKGVDIFFVLSGFLMFSISERRQLSPKQFLSDRVTRILPTYWLATILTFLCACISSKILQHSSSDVGLLIISLLFLPSSNLQNNYPTLYVGWSLNYEMFFYITFSFVLLCRPWHRIITMSILFTTVIIIYQFLHVNNIFLLTYTSPLLLEFLAGAWMAFLLTRPLQDHKAIFLVICVVIAMFIFGILMPRINYAGPAVLLVSASVLLERRHWIPKIPMLKTLGDASYSIYLFQQFAFDGIAHPLHFAARATHTAIDSNWVLVPLEFASAVGLGLVIHYLVEQRLTEAARVMLNKIIYRPARLVDEHQ
jgi:exopolysaccharide production protein ExoZ